MKKKNIEFSVYLLGIVGFAALYYELKAEFENQWLFVGAAVAYLALVRLVGFLLAKWLSSPSESEL